MKTLMLKSDCNDFRSDAEMAYKIPFFSEEEFESDLRMLKRMPKTFVEFTKHGGFSYRSFCNRFIIACNCFGVDFVISFLFEKTDSKYHNMLYTFILHVFGVESLKIESLQIDKQFNEKLVFAENQEM